MIKLPGEECLVLHSIIFIQSHYDYLPVTFLSNNIGFIGVQKYVTEVDVDFGSLILLEKIEQVKSWKGVLSIHTIYNHDYYCIFYFNIYIRNPLK